MNDKTVRLIAKFAANPRKYSRILIACCVAVLMLFATVAFNCGRGVEKLSKATSGRAGSDVSADLDRLSGLIESQRRDFELLSKQLGSISADVIASDRLTKQRVDQLADAISDATKSIDAVYADMQRTYDNNSAVFSDVRGQYEDIERRLRETNSTD
jgi:hypothetical protein